VKKNLLINLYYRVAYLKFGVLFTGLIILLSFLILTESSYSLEQRVFNKEVVKGERGAVLDKGRVYTWQDGNITRTVRVQPGLAVQKSVVNTVEEEVVARSGQMSIVKRETNRVEDTEVVFRGQSGELMTLPGGVLLVFEPELSREEVEGFFLENGIFTERVSERDFTKNAFFVQTEAGIASLDLANELAGKEGVRLSSPNWWREVTTK